MDKAEHSRSHGSKRGEDQGEELTMHDVMTGVRAQGVILNLLLLGVVDNFGPARPGQGAGRAARERLVNIAQVNRVDRADLVVAIRRLVATEVRDVEVNARLRAAGVSPFGHPFLSPGDAEPERA